MSQKHSLKYSILQSMITTVAISLFIATAWFSGMAWLGGDRDGRGWTRSSAQGLGESLVFFESYARLQAAHYIEEASEAQAFFPELDAGDLVLRRSGRSWAYVGSGHGPRDAGLMASQVTRAAYYAVDGRLYYAIPKGNMIFFRSLSGWLLETLVSQESTEVIFLAGNQVVQSSMKTRQGAAILPLLPEKTRDALKALGPQEIYVGKEELQVPGYMGFHFDPTHVFGEGHSKLVFYEGYCALPGPDGRPAGYIGVLVPERAMMDGVRKGIVGSLVIFLVAAALAAAGAWRVARRFLEPLSLEIAHIKRLCSELGGAGSEGGAMANGEDELTVLRRNIGDLERAVRRGNDAAKALELQRAGAAFAAKMAGLGEMAAGMAHEINTPLAVISIKAAQARELLQEKPLDLELLGRIHDTIAGTVDRISRIVRSLRSFARVGTQDEPKDVSVEGLLSEVKDLCFERFRVHGVALRSEISEAGLSLSCRESEIMQVLLNLLNNAYDAVQCRQDKWVELGARKNGDWLELWVLDNGEGIPPEVRGRIFDPFFSGKEPGKGTGLGLSISKGIIQSHGGSIEFDPQSQFTRFVIRLPLGPATGGSHV